MVWKNAREAIRDDSLVETRAKLPNPSWDLKRENFIIEKLEKSVF